MYNVENLDITMYFALLWGRTIAKAELIGNAEKAEKMSSWNRTNLIKLFSAWKREFILCPNIEMDDFFADKLKGII